MTNQIVQVNFDVSDEVVSIGLKGAFLTIRNLKNKQADPEFDKLKAEVLEKVLPTLSKEKIDEYPILAGFRQLHERVNRPGKKNIASPENLLNMLLENRNLPQVNLLVDIYNLVSIETQLALGAHDLGKVTGNIHLRLTTGQETFWPLGHSKPQGVGAGEYAYIDDANDVLCRLEVRQVEKTKVTLETSECFLIVQGNTNTSKQQIEDATQELIELITRFCGGETQILRQII